MASLFENTIQLRRSLERARGYVSEMRLMEELGFSRPTLHRAIKVLREEEKIEMRRGAGYRLVPGAEVAIGADSFTPKEMESLAVLWQMLENSQNEWVEQYADLREIVLRRLRSLGVDSKNWEGRVRYLPQHRRITPKGVFQKLCHALLHRKMVRFTYSKPDGTAAIREVHPQQLILYRNGWSLDALEESSIGSSGAEDLGLRQFSLDIVKNVREIKKPWKEVEQEVLLQVFAGGYGLFAGKPNAVAQVCFRGIAAFYAQREKWHPKQRKEEKPDGSVVLHIPYVAEMPQELLGDILRWGDGAEPLAPKGLRELWKGKVFGLWELSHKVR